MQKNTKHITGLINQSYSQFELDLYCCGDGGDGCCGGGGGNTEKTASITAKNVYYIYDNLFTKFRPK